MLDRKYEKLVDGHMWTLSYQPKILSMYKPFRAVIFKDYKSDEYSSSLTVEGVFKGLRLGDKQNIRKWIQGAARRKDMTTITINIGDKKHVSVIPIRSVYYKPSLVSIERIPALTLAPAPEDNK